MPNLIITGRPSGPLQTVTYLVQADADWVLVDPTYDALATWRSALPPGRPTAIWLTHGHFDHIAGLAEMAAMWPGLPVVATELTAAMCANPQRSGAALFGMPQEPAKATELIAPGAVMKLGGYAFQVIEAEGHCPGSVMFHCADEGGQLLAGDVLFEGSVGRWDLPGADYDTLATTIRERVMTLPDSTTVYPGHGPTTTIGAERRRNYIVQRMLAGERVN